MKECTSRVTSGIHFGMLKLFSRNPIYMFFLKMCPILPLHYKPVKEILKTCKVDRGKCSKKHIINGWNSVQ